jgi:hypothetical protein
MNTRLADKDKDLPFIQRAAVNFALEAELDDLLPERIEDLLANVSRVLALPTVEVILVEDETLGIPLGGLGLAYSAYLWDPRKVVAEELFMWVEPSAPASAALRLVRAADARTRENANVRSIDKVYARMGMREVQRTFMGTT